MNCLQLSLPRKLLLLIPLLVAPMVGCQSVDVGNQAPHWDRAALEAALGYAEKQRSSAIVVIQSGELVAERYRRIKTGPGFGYRNMLWGELETGEPVEDVASLQKSIVSILVGMAVDRGLLDLDASVSSYLGENWSAAAPEQESKIQLRHLLSMTSGLSLQLEYVAPSGERWLYNTTAYSKLVDVLEAVTGKEIATLTHGWLTEPVGMSNTEWRRRPWVTASVDANPLGLYTTAKDLARFGELMLSRGEWGKQRLVSSEYLKLATTPSQSLNPAYGYLWWLNGKPLRQLPSGVNRNSLVPSAPDDLYAAEGALGRKLYVVPSLDLVVVRLGDKPDDNFDEHFWTLLMAAVPAESSCGECKQSTGGARLYADVVHFADMGFHRTGSAVDRETTRWFAERLENMGGEVRLEKFQFHRFDGTSRVFINGEEIESIPLYYEGIGRLSTSKPFVASVNVLDSHFNSSALLNAIAQARAAGADLLVIATENSLGTLQVPNRRPELASGLPVVLVPGRYAEALKVGELRVEYDAQIIPGESANVIAEFSTHPGMPIILSTPLSGWFQCAAERGTGIAITLALAESLSKHYKVLVIGSPGHELLDHIGLEAYLANRKTDAALVAHLGANLALAGKAPGADTLRLVPDVSDPATELYQARRIALLRMDEAIAENVAVALAQAELTANINPPIWFGEGALWAEAVEVPLMSFVGSGPEFHSPLDVPERTTTPELLDQVFQSLDGAIRSFKEYSKPH